MQEHRGRLRWWTPKTNPTKHQKHSDTRCTTAEEFLPDSKCMTTSGAGLPVPSDPRLSSATKLPVHLDTTIWCMGQICGANPSKKRMGVEDGEAQWKVWTWLFF